MQKISVIMFILSLMLISSVLGTVDVVISPQPWLGVNYIMTNTTQLIVSVDVPSTCSFNITSLEDSSSFLGSLVSNDGGMSFHNTSISLLGIPEGDFNLSVNCSEIGNSSSVGFDSVELSYDLTPPTFKFNWWNTIDSNGSAISFANYSDFILQSDIFYSPSENVIDFSIEMNDDASGIEFVQVDLSEMSTFSTNHGGTCIGMLNLTLNGSAWVGNCTIGDFDSSDLMGGVESFTLFFEASDNAGHPAFQVYNSSNSSVPCYSQSSDCSMMFFPINLQDFGRPLVDDPTECFEFGTGTTNFSQETDFNDLNLLLDIEVNLSCEIGPGYGLPSSYMPVIFMNFSSLDFSSPAVAADIGNLIDAVDFDIVPPGQYGNSRIYVNSTAFAALNSSAIITFMNLPFMHQPNVIGDIPGEFLGVTSWVSAYNPLFGAVLGNLTFTVSGFSGYDISDTVNPVVNIDYPTETRYGSSLTLVNFTVNGTGSEPSYVTVTVNGSQYVFNNSVGGVNTANCINLSADQEVWRCLTTVNVGDGSHMVLINARDFGGSVGNIGSSNVSFIIDATAPVIIATNQTIAYGAAFSYDVNATDADSNITYQISDNVNFAIDSSTGILINHTVLSLGVYDFTINATDSVGNVGEKTFSVSVTDETNPRITAVTKQRINYSMPFGYQIIATDNVDISSYWVSDTTNFQINTTGYLSNATLLSAGIHTLTVYVNDTSGNQNSTTFDVSVKNVNTTAVNGTSPEINLTASNTSIMFNINSSVNLTVEVEEYEVNTSASTTVSIAGVNSSKKAVKARNISIDSASRGNLTWAYVKIYYNDLEVSGLDESSLRMYYFNISSNQWEQVANSGVDTVNNFVWGNVTHFSVYGLFTDTTTTTTSSSSNSGGSSGGSSSGGSSGFYSTQSTLENSLRVKYMHNKYSVNFKVNDDIHSVQVNKIYSDRVNFKISSDPFYVDAYIGKETLVDVDGDGINDLSINVNGAYTTTADVLFNLIDQQKTEVTPTDSEVAEEKPTEVESQTPAPSKEETKEQQKTKESQKTEELTAEKKEGSVAKEPKKNSNVGGYVLAIVLVGIVFAIVFGNKKKTTRKKRY